MHFTGLFDSFAHAAAPVAVTGLWQGLAIALALALCLQITRRLSAGQRFLLWSGGFLAAAGLPLAPLVFSLNSGHSAAGSAGTAPQGWFQLDARWSLVLLSLWLIAASVRTVDLASHMIRLYRLWRSAVPVNVATSLQRKRSFRVCSTHWLDRPSVIGFFAPRVLIPDWLLPRLAPEELNQIVLHESTHLARYDDWTNLLQKLCLVLFPLNPSLWWIDRQLAKEREMACDETVVRITQAPRAYAACLASLAERGLARRREALSLGAWQRRSELVSRIHRILRDHPGLPPAAARLLLGAFGCGLLVVTFELARCPQLVAFVPAVERAQSVPPAGSASAQFGDAVYPANPRLETLTPGARMVQTKAVMPAASIPKPFAGRDHAKVRAEGELRAAASEPDAVLGVIETHQVIESRVNSDAPQQVIVFTAWEQIDPRGSASRTTVADYETQPATNADTSTQAAASTTANKLAAGSLQHRATVTQLILRVVPTDSNTSQPIAIPLGWFVIQL